MMLTIEIRYHLSGAKCFEYFYVQEVRRGKLHSYFPFGSFLQPVCGTEAKNASGTHLLSALCEAWQTHGSLLCRHHRFKVCHNRRINQNKVFSSSAKRGQTSTGWFYGFKLFLVVNGLGEIVQALLTPGNVADGATATLKKLFKGLTGLGFAKVRDLSITKPSTVCLNRGVN